MYVSNWIPPEMQEDDNAERDDGGVRRSLMALVVAASIALATMLAWGYVGHRLACAAFAIVEPC